MTRSSWFTSDHGEEFLEHGRPIHGQSVYAELTQVPLVVRWPAALFRPGSTSTNRCSRSTSCRRCSMPAGCPILKACKGRRPSAAPPGGRRPRVGLDPARPAFSEKAITTGGAAPTPQETESFGVIDGHWLLIHNTVRVDDSPEFELYHMQQDPLNQTDLAAQHQDVVERLGREIDRWRRVAETNRLPEDGEASEGLSPEELERLRSLGYIR